MVSPACEVKDGSGAYASTANGVDVTPGDVITIRLADSNVDQWEIACITTDDTNVAATVNAGLTVNALNKTASFTAPAAGAALRFRSRVNGGLGPNNTAKPSYTTTFCVYTLTSGARTIAADETTEGSPFGWTKTVNDFIRAGGGSGAVADDIVKHSGPNIDTVAGFNGIPIRGTRGTTPRIGGAYEYNEQTSNGFKLTKPVVFHANHYGCVGDGTTDDTAKLQALFELAAVTPGATIDQGVGPNVIVFPNDARYKCDGRLVFDSIQSVIVRGPANIHFTGSGSDPFIKLLSCQFWIFEDISFTYENAAFSGDIVRTGHGTNVSDAGSITFERCFFYGTADALGYHGAKSCLSLKNCIDMRIHDCGFTAALIGIDGYHLTEGFANTVLIDGCTFNKLGNGVPTDRTYVDCACIHNPGEAWTITNNTFEPLQGAGYTEISAHAIHQDLNYFAWALNISGNWIGDGDNAGPWIRVKPLGGLIAGNLISGGNTAVMIGGADGVAITGNRISGAIQFVQDDALGNSAGVFVGGNSIQAAVPYIDAGNYCGRFIALGNEDSSDNTIGLPLVIGDYGCSLSRVILNGNTWDPGTVAAGGYAVSDEMLSVSAIVGMALAVGVSPAPPDGVLVTAIVSTNSFAKVTVWNMSGSDWTPGTLTMKFFGAS